MSPQKYLFYPKESPHIPYFLLKNHPQTHCFILKNTPKFLKLDKYLGHEFKLVDMVDFEMFEKQQQNRRYSFDNDFFVTVDVDS